MLQFKQWDELAEPRHKIDGPTSTPSLESLRPTKLPEVECKIEFDISKFERVFIGTKTVEALFPERCYQRKVVGQIKVKSPHTSTKSAVKNQSERSWDFHENFPEEVEPLEAASRAVHQIGIPIYELEGLQKTLLVILEENFMIVSPILINYAALSLRGILNGFTGSVHIWGHSDRVAEMRLLTRNHCDLVPPELVTGFVGAVISTIIKLEHCNFRAFIAPSEGHLGFEKITLSQMSDMIELCAKALNISEADYEAYRKHCIKHWKTQSTAIGAQPGLYL